jgi:hypothetical protein
LAKQNLKYKYRNMRRIEKWDQSVHSL